VPSRGETSTPPLCPCGGDQRLYTLDVRYPSETIGQHVQRHLASHLRQSLELSVNSTHAQIDRA
jgi:hypothetical protein